MKIRSLQSVLLSVLLIFTALTAFAAGEMPDAVPRFDIKGYQVEGNTLIPADHLESTLSLFAGKGRDFGAVQEAIDALEKAYRDRSFSMVAVSLPEQVVERAQVAEILLINKCPLTAEQIRKLPNLRFIAVTATGFNCVDIEAAGRQGISVSNLPIYGTNSVAQFVIALLLEHCHHVGIHDAAVRAGEWSACPYWSFWKTPQVELYGKTMGIVGFGRIGRRVGELAHALGMDVVAYDVLPERHPGYEPFSWVGIEEAFSKADFVSLHAPLTKDNKRFVDKALLAKMKPTAVLINAARGELINPDDLALVLNNEEIACAALDVAEVEPISADNPLLRARNTIMTPHMAWASLEARRRMVHITAENIKAFIAKDPQNVVNKTFLETCSR